MSINTGTLVGATVRPNDSNDVYPSAIDNDLKGTLHSVNTDTDMDNIPAARRSAGMLCYVFADQATYQLQNDLVTWLLQTAAAGGTTGPGSGGNSATVQLISGNFGVWTAVPSQNAAIVAQIPLNYKSDLQAFPTRAITYLQGQFSLNADFTGTTITLGTLPVNSQPAVAIQKYIIVANIEMYLGVDTEGNITLTSKDGFNLPTGNTTAPYYIELFFNPVIEEYSPTVYSYTRTQNFTKSNCGNGYAGSAVSYSQTYTSTVSEATAEAAANNDPNYNTAGQAFADAASSETYCTVITPNLNIINNSTVETIPMITFGDGIFYGNITPGQTRNYEIPAGTYQVQVSVNAPTGAGEGVDVEVNGVTQHAPAARLLTFNAETTPITITITDIEES